MSTAANPFSAPAEPGGNFTWEEHNGRLLLIEPTEQEHEVLTKYGPKNPVRATITVIDAPQAPEVYEDTLIFPKVLIDQTKSLLGQQVLARLGQGVPTPGQKPPWKLMEANAADVATGIRYLEARKMTNPFSQPAPAAIPQDDDPGF